VDDAERRTPGPAPVPPGDPSGADDGAASRAEADAEAEAAAEATLEAKETLEDGAGPLGSDLMEDLRPIREAATRAIGEPPRPSRGPTAAVLAATLFLAGSAILSVSFMLTRGGLGPPLSTPSPTGVALSSATPTPTEAPAPTPTASPTSTVAPTVAPSPEASPSPTSSLLALLEPCPDKPDCYLYTVRTDDSLARIAVRFGVPYATILALNPWIVDPSIIHPGEKVTLPPPGK